MIIDVELTRRAHDRYVARALQFPDVIIEAASRETALAQLRAALIARQRAGVELVQIALDPSDSVRPGAWPRHTGAFPDDAAYQCMLAEVARQRRACDEANPA